MRRRAAARRRSCSRSRGFVAFQPLGRDINDNVYAPFFAVLFVLFSFGLHEPRGRVLIAGFAFVFAANIARRSTIDAYASTVDRRRSSAGW